MEFGPTASLDLEEYVNGLSRIFMEKVRSASGKSKEGIRMTIFRVPDNIRKTNVGSFEPKIVSLGPYHHGNKRFRATGERIKLSYASNFFGDTNMNMDLLQRIVELFMRLESTSRCAYSEQISMPSNEFVEMMMLDCAFTAQFLKELSGWARREKEEYSWTWAVPSIINDMLIVENQFPLLLLFDLLKIVYPSDYHPLTERLFRDIILQIHHTLSPTPLLFPATLIETSAHLLHLFHSTLISGLEKKTSDLYTVYLPSFPSAETLQAMRIQFANNTDGSSFLDIAFDKSKRIIKIPQLAIDDDNISLLRNLIALEQQCQGVGYYISAYVWFMNCLIDTDKDVAVLREHKIIVSRLRSDKEVAHIFDELSRSDTPFVDLDHFYLAEVVNNGASYCKNRYNRLWALWNFSGLRQNYFKDRWVTFVVAVTIFFNFLTLVQTVFACLSYAKQ